MNTRFYNIRLLTMDGTMDVVPGEVWVEGNRISYAGPSAFMGDANTDAITLLSGIVKSMEMAIFSCRALKMPILIPL